MTARFPSLAPAVVALALVAACGQDDSALSSARAASREGGGEREHARKLLSTERFAGLVRPYTGATNAIRGVAGGGLPWVFDEIEARLSSDGMFRVKAEGLVIDPNDQTAKDRGVAGTNPSATMKAILSCQTIVNGAAQVVNVSTAAFPATPEGDVEIADTITVPSPCFAPIVFVTSGGGAWFAASGF